MKFSKFLLFPLLALGLVGCNMIPIPSLPGSEQPTSQTSETTSKTDGSETDPTSTPEPGGETGSSSETDKPTQTEWSTADQKLLKKYLNGNLVPYAPVKGAMFMELEFPENSGEYILVYAKPQNATQADIDGFCATILKNEAYTDVTSENPDGGPTFRLMSGALPATELNEEVLIVAELYQGMFLAQFIYHIDNRVWPADEISVYVEAKLGVADMVIPEPTFEFSDVQITYLEKYQALLIDLYTPTSMVTAYEADLTKAGWVKVDAESWADPNELILLTPFYDEDYECTSIIVENYPAIPTDWTSEEKAVIQQLFNNNMLPFIYIPGAHLATLPNEDTGSYDLIYIKEAGATLEELEAYVTALLAVEGYKDVTEAYGGDKANRIIEGSLANKELNEKVIVVASYLEGAIVIQYLYDIDIRVWPEEVINTNVNQLLGLEGIAIPKPDFAFLDISIKTPNAEAGLIVDLTINEDPSAAYTTTLTSAGWSKLSENAYVNTAENVLIQLQYSAEAHIFRITIVGYVSAANAPTAWTADEEAVLKHFLNGNVLPFFNIPNGHFLIHTDKNTGQQTLLYSKNRLATVEELTTLCNQLLAITGSVDLTETYGGNESTRFILIPLANTEYNESVLVVASYVDGTIILQFEYHIDVRVWPEADMNAVLMQLFGLPGVSLPVPEFEFLNMVTGVDPEAGIFQILLTCAEDPSASYEATLLAAGWTKTGENTYADAHGKLQVTYGYVAQQKAFVINVVSIYDPDRVMPSGWTAREEDLMKIYLNNNVLPYFNIEGGKIVVFTNEDETTSLGYYKQGGVTQELFDSFVASLLKIEGWTDVTEEYGGDAITRVIYAPLANTELNEAVIIIVSLIEGSIYVDFIYDIDVRTWPAEIIQSHLETLFGNGTVVIPEPGFTFLDLDVEVDQETGLYLIGLSGTGDQTAAYTASLTAAGWTDLGEGAYLDPSGTFVLMVQYNPTVDMLILIIGLAA